MSMPLPAERGVPSHSEEWVPCSPELMVGLALLSERRSAFSFWGMSSPLSRARYRSHSEEWVLRSPELVVGRASTAPLNQRVTYEHAAPVWASEFLRPPELCDRSLALLVEPALLPSTRGASMSVPLPSERLSSLSLRGMSSSPLQGIERSNKCTRETLGTFLKST